MNIKWITGIRPYRAGVCRRLRQP